MTWMLKPFWCVAICLLPGLLAMAHADERCEQLVVVSSAQSPYLWMDAGGRPQGAYLELTEQLARDLSIELQLLLEPTAEAARQEVTAGRADLLLSELVTTAGLEQLDYVYPAVQEQLVVAWAGEQQGHLYQGWNDLRGKRGVLVAAQVMPSSFADFAQANLTLVSAENFAKAVEMLSAGQADFIIYDKVAGAAWLAGQDPSVSVIALPWPLFTEFKHVALSHNSACNSPWLRGQLALKLRQYADDGLWQAWQDKSVRVLLPAVSASVQGRE